MGAMALFFTPSAYAGNPGGVLGGGVDDGGSGTMSAGASDGPPDCFTPAPPVPEDPGVPMTELYLGDPSRPLPVLRHSLFLSFRDGVTQEQTCELYNRWQFYWVDEDLDPEINASYVVYWQEISLVEAIQSLMQEPIIERVEPVLLGEMHLIPNDPYFSAEWYLLASRAPEAWDLTTGSSDYRVAVIDTGIERDHPDLAGQLDPNGISCATILRQSPGKPAYWTVDCRYGAGYGHWKCPDFAPNCPLWAEGGGARQHGTAVAGTLGARTNNGIGIAGVAWNLTIFPVRLTPIDGNKMDNAGLWKVLRLLRNRVANLHTINISFGWSTFPYGDPDNDEVRWALRELQKSKDTVVVASAGNDNSSQRVYPAAYPLPGQTEPEVLGVAALGPDYCRASFPGGKGSNYSTPADPWTELSSFGKDIVSLWFTPNPSGPPSGPFYSEWWGTSFSSPLVAGLAHLVKSKYPGLARSDRERWIRSASPVYPDRCANPPSGFLPKGRVDFYCAVRGLPPDCIRD